MQKIKTLLKYIWNAFLALFSGFFTKNLSPKSPKENGINISKNTNTKIEGNISNSDLKITKNKDSIIKKNKFN